MVRPGLPRSLQATGSGKEELRAGLLVPYLLRLRDERGEAAARALLSTVGIPASILEDESEWISVAAARRALHALATALGEEAISRRGGWMTHPETLSSYVRMLRVRRMRVELPASAPIPLPGPQPEPYDPSGATPPPLAAMPGPIDSPNPPVFKLLALHDAGMGDFLNRDRMGYIQDRQHVAGFEPHRFSAIPGLGDREPSLGTW